MNNNLLNNVLGGYGAAVTEDTIKILKHYLSTEQQQQPQRKVVPNQGDKSNLKIGK